MSCISDDIQQFCEKPVALLELHNTPNQKFMILFLNTDATPNIWDFFSYLQLWKAHFKQKESAWY